MLTRIDINDWSPMKVRDWLAGLCHDASWLNSTYIIEKNISGKELLLMAPKDLEDLGARKVDLQEHILEAIGRLRLYNFNMNNETLQTLILRLGCQSRSLHKQLTAKRAVQGQNIVLSPDFKDRPRRQKISLDTLVSVSSLVTTVMQITDALNCVPFSEHDDSRSMKSLFLALSIELTSTAQRDQFVEKPNDIIERCSKVLADYCDRIVQSTMDPILVQPIQLESAKTGAYAPKQST